MDEGTLKKEVRKKVETLGKLWGYVTGEGEFENSGESPLGLRKRAQKIFEKSFEKMIGNVCIGKLT